MNKEVFLLTFLFLFIAINNFTGTVNGLPETLNYDFDGLVLFWSFNKEEYLIGERVVVENMTLVNTMNNVLLVQEIGFGFSSGWVNKKLSIVLPPFNSTQIGSMSFSLPLNYSGMVPYKVKLTFFVKTTTGIYGKKCIMSPQYYLKFSRYWVDLTITSINIPESVERGSSFTAEIVLKNRGLKEVNNMEIEVFLWQIPVYRSHLSNLSMGTGEALKLALNILVPEEFPLGETNITFLFHNKDFSLSAERKTTVNIGARQVAEIYYLNSLSLYNDTMKTIGKAMEDLDLKEKLLKEINLFNSTFNQICFEFRNGNYSGMLNLFEELSAISKEISDSIKEGYLLECRRRINDCEKFLEETCEKGLPKKQLKESIKLIEEANVKYDFLYRNLKKLSSDEVREKYGEILKDCDLASEKMIETYNAYHGLFVKVSMMIFLGFFVFLVFFLYYIKVFVLKRFK